MAAACSMFSGKEFGSLGKEFGPLGFLDEENI
jgi:hypothetical protein